MPIVIRNAEVIASRDSSTFNSGNVDVVVYPPIPIDDWTHDNLSERIAEVRQLYLDTLKDWPTDELPTPSLYSAQPPRSRRRRRREEGHREEGRSEESRGQEDARQEDARQEGAGQEDHREEGDGGEGDAR